MPTDPDGTTTVEPPAGLDLEAIEKRANAATPGPWHRVAPPWNDHTAWVNAGSPDPHFGRFVCDLDPDMAGAELDEDEINDVADAEFIAHARADVPELVAEVRRLRALVQNALIFGTAYVWQKPAGERLVLPPTEVSVVIPSGQETPEVRGYRKAIADLRDEATRLLDAGYLAGVYARYDRAADFLEAQIEEGERG